MMATVHGLIGCAIATQGGNPIVSGGLIVASHWILDLLPHWDFGTDWQKRSKAKTGMLAIIDTFAAFSLCALLFGQTLPIMTIIIAVVLANLPDWIQAPWFMFFGKQQAKDNLPYNVLRSLFYWIYSFQERYLHTTDTFPHGVYTQLFVIVFFSILLLMT